MIDNHPVRRFIPILFLLSIGLLNAADEISFAQKLFDLGLYEEARFEFERLNTPKFDDIDYNIAKCYVKSNDLINSIKQYDLIISNTMDYEILKASAIECAGLELYRGNPRRAIDCIQKAIARGADIDVDRLAHIRKIAERRWREIDVEAPKRRSPALAQAMSVILPGSGQAYAGDILNGLKSLGVNTAIWYLVISAMDGGYYPRGITAFYLFMPRYWLGASIKASEIAQENNLQDYLRACREAAEKI